MDLLPTCLELAGVDYPSTFNEKQTTSMDGKSLIPLIQEKISTTHDTLYWEHVGGRAVRIGDWKMSALRRGDWELFDLSVDPTEINNLAEEQPERYESMNALWEEWATRVKLAEQTGGIGGRR